ncbi:MAG: Smr/MutS family protein [Proteobacteria bacterium]|nr:Smr/MutS family protein [Pseudomonadota bacterium]MBU1419407.1 Smr/MutS family protein [Pseudomonadota bacterium]MBU1454247.1 Smr/MutS family protein [Pseudomonadota bacterium]
MFKQKTVNLEQGLPTVEQALQRLQREISTARLEQIRILTLIHGYGSSGKGGAIRIACRKNLEYLCHRGEIKEFIPGEEFSRRQGSTKQLLSRFPQLSEHSHLNRANKGITLVVVF